MTDQVDVQEVEQDNAAFEAAFSGNPAPEAPTPEPEVKAETQAGAEVKADEPEAEAPQQEAEPPRNQWGYTDEEMKTLLSKAGRYDELERKFQERDQKVHGKLGEVFKALQHQGRGQVEITVEDLDDELREQFPEMAEMQVRSLKKVLAKALGAGPAQPPQQAQPAAFDPNVIEERVTHVKDEVSQAVEKRLLKRDHPDWESVVETQEFRGWLGAQPAEYQQQMNSSWDADFIGHGLGKFKAWREAQKKASTKRTARLEQAVTPTGGAAATPAPDEMDAFLSGFNSGRGR